MSSSSQPQEPMRLDSNAPSSELENVDMAGQDSGVQEERSTEASTRDTDAMPISGIPNAGAPSSLPPNPVEQASGDSKAALEDTEMDDADLEAQKPSTDTRGRDSIVTTNTAGDVDTDRSIQQGSSVENAIVLEDDSGSDSVSTANPAGHISVEGSMAPGSSKESAMVVPDDTARDSVSMANPIPHVSTDSTTMPGSSTENTTFVPASTGSSSTVSPPIDQTAASAGKKRSMTSDASMENAIPIPDVPQNPLDILADAAEQRRAEEEERPRKRPKGKQAAYKTNFTRAAGAGLRHPPGVEGRSSSCYSWRLTHTNRFYSTGVSQGRSNVPAAPPMQTARPMPPMPTAPPLQTGLPALMVPPASMSQPIQTAPLRPVTPLLPAPIPTFNHSHIVVRLPPGSTSRPSVSIPARHIVSSDRLPYCTVYPLPNPHAAASAQSRAWKAQQLQLLKLRMSSLTAAVTNARRSGVMINAPPPDPAQRTAPPLDSDGKTLFLNPNAISLLDDVKTSYFVAAIYVKRLLLAEGPRMVATRTTMSAVKNAYINANLDERWRMLVYQARFFEHGGWKGVGELIEVVRQLDIATADQRPYQQAIAQL